MGLKDIFVSGAVAGFTMLGALALVAPVEVNASRDAIETVNVNGVEMSVRTLKARRRPTAELTLHNPSDEALVMRGTLKLYETSLANLGGRMAQPSIERWEEDCLYVLNAGETKKVKLRAKKKLRKRTMGHFTFTFDGDDNANGDAGEVLYTARFRPKRAKAKAPVQVASLVRGMNNRGW